LITSKLLEGPIDLKRFYIRRFFRLMPAAWIYLATIFVLWRFVGIKITSYADLVAGLFFYRNLSGGTGAAVHFWSLSLEEQFYLVWPPILLLTCLRRSVWIALAGVCGVAAWRFSHWSAYDRFPFYLRTEVRADAILLGCLLAMLLSNQRIRAFAIRWSRLWAIPAFAVLVFSIVRSNPLPTLYEGVAIMGLIATTTLHSGSVLVKPLLFAPLVWLGTVLQHLYMAAVFREFQWHVSSVCSVHRPAACRAGKLLLHRAALHPTGTQTHNQQAARHLGALTSRRERDVSPEWITRQPPTPAHDQSMGDFGSVCLPVLRPLEGHDPWWSFCLDVRLTLQSAMEWVFPGIGVAETRD